MKVWIVTARFGQGHFSAATAIEEEYKARGYEVIVKDIIEILYPFFSSWIYGVFNHIICRHSAIYNFLNKFGRNPKKEHRHSQRIENAFNDIQPDVIVTTWSACARLLSPLPVPIYVYITDLGVHAGWIAPNVQGYFAATHDVAQMLLNMGVEKEKIHIHGIPVKKVFREISHKSKSSNKILIMGGGLGILPWVDKLLEELCKYPELMITVIVGNNHRLYKKLEHKYPCVTVIGFTDDVSHYLEESDLLVSKPGGVSLFESIYAETPCVAVFPSYTHELENADFIQKQEIGAVVWSGECAGTCILNLLKNGEKRQKYQLNMIKMKQELQNQQWEEQYIVEHAI